MNLNPCKISMMKFGRPDKYYKHLNINTGKRYEGILYENQYKNKRNLQTERHESENKKRDI